MKITQVYKTSKGTFWSLDEALKKCNRKKYFDCRPGDPGEYEKPEICHVLLDDYGECFELKQVEVK
jgi:hypothetical protein